MENFLLYDKINNPSPNPKIAKPKIKKKDVDNFGLKFKGLSELQVYYWYIFNF
jgi:cephalosporin-C deacetylase-like acetyl esterase